MGLAVNMSKTKMMDFGLDTASKFHYKGPHEENLRYTIDRCLPQKTGVGPNQIAVKPNTPITRQRQKLADTAIAESQHMAQALGKGWWHTLKVWIATLSTLMTELIEQLKFWT
ncbi:hypothetical protein SELMODRAFT_432281 [Selaginella moellendorffii]|uniref:Uncharacterized protein n=1 Tax=Selaginella moellendorffii TaxID=88036 RepID=D8TFI8_SELML|nr:hypothetical protein SELMODRAFT_432281 [Selaginella moellendorffii]